MPSCSEIVQVAVLLLKLSEPVVMEEGQAVVVLSNGVSHLLQKEPLTLFDASLIVETLAVKVFVVILLPENWIQKWKLT